MQRKVKRSDTRDDGRFKVVGHSMTREQGWSELKGRYHIGIAPKLKGGRCVTSTRSQTVQRLEVIEGPDPNATRVSDCGSGHAILILFAEHGVRVFLSGELNWARQPPLRADPKVDGWEDSIRNEAIEHQFQKRHRRSRGIGRRPAKFGDILFDQIKPLGSQVRQESSREFWTKCG